MRSVVLMSTKLSDQYADTEIEVDGEEGCIKALMKLKHSHSHLQIILSIGGGGQGSAHFPIIASSDAGRQVFSKNVKELVELYGFDGIDSESLQLSCSTLTDASKVDWEHPHGIQQGIDYVYLLAALRSLLPEPTYTLTSALPAGEWVLRDIDLAAASSYLDFINLMTYDFSGPWVDRVGHQSQLFTPKHPHSDAATISCSSAVMYVLSKGVRPKGIVMGIPVYGRSFLGANKIGHPYSGSAGEEGTFEYKDLPRPNAQEHVDQSAGAAFCLGGDGGFVTYDNPQTVEMKAGFVKSHRLAGLFYWHGAADVKGERSLVETGYNKLHNL